MTTHIRPVEPGDLRALYEIQQQEAVMPFLLAWPSLRFATVQAWYDALSPDDHVLVAASGPDVVGYCELAVDRGRLRHGGTLTLAVSAGNQGEGIGTALLLAILDVADA